MSSSEAVRNFPVLYGYVPSNRTDFFLDIGLCWVSRQQRLYFSVAMKRNYLFINVLFYKGNSFLEEKVGFSVLVLYMYVDS